MQHFGVFLVGIYFCVTCDKLKRKLSKEWEKE